MQYDNLFINVLLKSFLPMIFIIIGRIKAVNISLKYFKQKYSNWDTVSMTICEYIGLAPIYLAAIVLGILGMMGIMDVFYGRVENFRLL